MRRVATARKDGEVVAIIERDDEGRLYARRSMRHKREAVHPTLNPDLPTYTARLADNFGWEVDLDPA